VRPGLTKHRKFLRLTHAIGSAPLALGHLEFLWESSYEAGDDYLGNSQDVEVLARWDGEVGKLTNALLTAGGDGMAGFIEEIEGRPGFYAVHDLYENAPEYVQKRMTRELERKQRGKTISDLRREAGKKGRAAQLAQQTANVGQASGKWRANGDTPAPAPIQLPAPVVKTSLSEQKNCSDQASTSLKKSGTQPSQEACRLAALLKAEILRNKADYRVTAAQERKWAASADRMLRLDGRKFEEVADLIRWCQRDSFWMANVLSMDKLRAKFDELQLRRLRVSDKPNGKSGQPTALHSFPEEYYAEGVNDGRA